MNHRVGQESIKGLSNNTDKTDRLKGEEGC